MAWAASCFVLTVATARGDEHLKEIIGEADYAIAGQAEADPDATPHASVMVTAIVTALPAGPATTLVLRHGALPAGLPAHQRVLWQVLALEGRDILARSKTQPVELP